MFNKLVALSLALLICVGSSAQSPTIEVSNTTETIEGRNFYVHLVKKGETLYSLCRLYQVTEDELKLANPGALTNGLSEGQKLLFPQKKGQTLASPKPVPPRTHAVVKGETIYGIAKMHGLQVGDIIELNPEAKAGISLGQLLVVDKEVLAKKRTQQNAVATGQHPAATATTHHVKPQETLFSICQRYNIDQQDLLQANPVLKDGLKVEQTLMIPTAKKQQPAPVAAAAPVTKHTVLKGETIYSIARDYKTSHVAILADNPQAELGLQVGMSLTIKPGQNDATAPASLPKTILVHKIEPGETLYALARLNGCTIKDIEDLNPGLDFSHIAVGTEIKIPSTSIPKQEIAVHDSSSKQFEKLSTQANATSGVCDSLFRLNARRVANVAVVLPFFQTANDTLHTRDLHLKRDPRMYGKSVPFIEFYEGVLLAIDSLKQQGVSVNLKTYDSSRDSLADDNIINELSEQNLDLIIGPASQDEFEPLARFAQSRGIPIVSPLSTNTLLAINHNTTILANTPRNIRVEAEAFYAKNDITNLINFVIIFNGHVNEFDNIDKIKQNMLPFFASAEEMNSRLKIVKFSPSAMLDIEAALVDSGKNVVIIPSEDQAFINDIITKLYQFQKRYVIELHGMAIWEVFKNIELDYLYDFNFHFVTSNYRDYSNAKVKNFVNKFRATFNSEPSKLGFQGYDIALYFIKMASRYGTNLIGCAEYNPYTGLQTSFHFTKLYNGSGLINTHVNVVEYTHDYQRKLVPFDYKSERQKYEAAVKAKGIQQLIDAKNIDLDEDID